MKFAGYTIVYTEGKEDNGNGSGEDSEFVRCCPPFRKEILKLLSLKPEQKFTQPPPASRSITGS